VLTNDEGRLIYEVIAEKSVGYMYGVKGCPNTKSPSGHIPGSPRVGISLT